MRLRWLALVPLVGAGVAAAILAGGPDRPAALAPYVETLSVPVERAGAGLRLAPGMLLRAYSTDGAAPAPPAVFRRPARRSDAPPPEVAAAFRDLGARGRARLVLAAPIRLWAAPYGPGGVCWASAGLEEEGCDGAFIADDGDLQVERGSDGRTVVWSFLTDAIGRVDVDRAQVWRGENVFWAVLPAGVLLPRTVTLHARGGRSYAWTVVAGEQ